MISCQRVEHVIVPKGTRASTYYAGVKDDRIWRDIEADSIEHIPATVSYLHVKFGSTPVLSESVLSTVQYIIHKHGTVVFYYSLIEQQDYDVMVMYHLRRSEDTVQQSYLRINGFVVQFGLFTRGLDGIYIWDVYYENADTSDEKRFIGNVTADSMSIAIEKASLAFNIPGHDIVVSLKITG